MTIVTKYPISKGIKKAITWSYFHNISRLFDVLSNFPFTASETMRDYYL